MSYGDYNIKYIICFTLIWLISGAIIIFTTGEPNISIIYNSPTIFEIKSGNLKSEILTINLDECGFGRRQKHCEPNLKAYLSLDCTLYQSHGNSDILLYISPSIENDFYNLVVNDDINQNKIPISYNIDIKNEVSYYVNFILSYANDYTLDKNNNVILDCEKFEIFTTKK